MHVSSRASVYWFTLFGPYLVHIEICITCYNSERREYWDQTLESLVIGFRLKLGNKIVTSLQ
jgi:hypothetical protein